MANLRQLAVDLGIILILILGIAQFRRPGGARRGNLTAALALLCALAVVLGRSRITDLSLVVPVLLAGSLVGWMVAGRVSMIQIPAMVAFQHGAGGIAAFLISFVELSRAGGLSPIGRAAGLSGLVIGAATFSGSMIAAGKLANRLKQTPMVLPGHNSILSALAAAVVVLGLLSAGVPGYWPTHEALLALLLLSMVLGVVFSMRIGGADMPVLISFLNATAGLAAAFCGIAIQNRLLIACGATVAASGSILTQVMCRAMNRGLAGVFAGLQPSGGQPMPAPATGQTEPARALAEAAPHTQSTGRPPEQSPFDRASAALRSANTVIIIPGYGMALAEAQFAVVQLAEKLEQLGKQVKFGIHPVAGRMPGHMHVLLAEAEIDYGKLFELDQINAELAGTDVALVVGACDVVNTAAIDVENTPISGMPIFRVHEARHVVVCNLDEKPGYSGVDNPLYKHPKTILLLGDAQETVTRLREQL